MGAWGPGLYSDDIALDIKNDFVESIENGIDDEQLIAHLKEKYSPIVNSDDASVFWYVLADLLYRYGRLTDEIKNLVIDMIERKEGLDLYEELEKKREKVLEKLKSKLESPQPARRKVRLRVPYVTNPWNIGDHYAYKIHTKYAKMNDCYGKYLVFAKVGNKLVEYSDPDEYYSVLVIYSKIFDEIPQISDLKDIRFLIGGLDPEIIIKFKDNYSSPPKGYPTDALTCAQCYLDEIHIHRFYIWEMWEKSFYSEKYYTFIGNDPSIELSDDGYATLYDSSSNEYNILQYDYPKWKDIDY